MFLFQGRVIFYCPIKRERNSSCGQINSNRIVFKKEINNQLQSTLNPFQDITMKLFCTWNCYPDDQVLYVHISQFSNYEMSFRNISIPFLAVTIGLNKYFVHNFFFHLLDLNTLKLILIDLQSYILFFEKLFVEIILRRYCCSYIFYLHLVKWDLKRIDNLHERKSLLKYSTGSNQIRLEFFTILL